jgi:hypothetical protein
VNMKTALLGIGLLLKQLCDSPACTDGVKAYFQKVADDVESMPPEAGKVLEQIKLPGAV